MSVFHLPEDTEQFLYSLHRNDKRINILLIPQINVSYVLNCCFVFSSLEKVHLFSFFNTVNHVIAVIDYRRVECGDGLFVFVVTQHDAQSLRMYADCPVILHICD